MPDNHQIKKPEVVSSFEAQTTSSQSKSNLTNGKIMLKNNFSDGNKKANRLTYSNNPALRKQVKKYHENGYVITPLRDKIPIQKDWQKQQWQEEINHGLFANCSSLGFVIPKNIVVIDVDNHGDNDGSESLEKMSKHYGFNFKSEGGFIVNTASGGFHLYYKVPSVDHDFKIANSLPDFPRVEFKSVNRQVVIPESILSDGRKYESHIIFSDFDKIKELPHSIFFDITKKQTASLGDTQKQADVSYANHPADIEQFESYLQSHPIIMDGERNNKLYAIVCDGKNRGISPDKIFFIISQWQKQNVVPSVSNHELRQIISSAEKYSKYGIGTKSIVEEWDAPILFDDFPTPEITADILPSSLKEFAKELSNSTETPEGMSVMATIAVLATALQGKFEVRRKEDDLHSETVNIYSIVTLPPANRKSAVLKACASPLVEWEKEQKEILEPEIRKQKSRYESDKKIIEGMRKGLRILSNQESGIQAIADKEARLKEPETLPRLFITDATPESLAILISEQNNRMSILSDEGGIVDTMAGLYNGGNANIDILLKGWDGGWVRQKRRERDLDIKPLLTINLTVQPVIIQNMGGKKSFSGKGLLERFLYCLPRSNLGYRSNDKPSLSIKVRNDYNEKIRALLNLPYGEVPVFLHLDREAYKEWRKFENVIETDLRPDGRLAICQGWGGKICGHALRMAGLFHVAEYGGAVTAINKNTVGKALELCSLLTSHAIAAFNSMEIDPDIRDSKEILRWICDNEHSSFIKADLTKRMQNRVNMNAARIDKLLNMLSQRNIISNPIREGKKTMRYMTNPAILA